MATFLGQTGGLATEASAALERGAVDLRAPWMHPRRKPSSPARGPGSVATAAAVIAFAHPWLALLLPAPLLVHWLLPPYKQAQAGVRVPFFASLVRITGQHRNPAASPLAARLAQAVLVLCWLLAVLALTRPQRIEPPLHREQPTRDLLLLVDLSASMDTRDFTDASGQRVDRVAAVK